MEALYGYNIQSVLVEGGAVLLQHFINENSWDEARVITNTKLEIEAGPDAPVMAGAKLWDQQTLGPDEIRFYKPA